VVDGTPSAHAAAQYATTTGNLTARIALHQYGTNPQDWFSWLDEHLPLAGDVVEIGAGTGLLWTRIDHVGRGLTLTLTDFSPAMCRQLRTVAGARVARADAAALPFCAASFDTAVANHMLYHVDDPDAVLGELVRVLRPGGRLAVAVNGRDHLAELDALGAAIGRPDLAVTSSQNGLSAESAPALVARHFDTVAVERYPGDLVIPVAAPALAYLASRADEPLTPAQRAAAERLIEARISADGAFPVRKHTVLITARRRPSP
jgi:SAM-dependent methyltransferase